MSGSEPAEAPKWKPITLVTIGIVCFALLFERAGMLPALVALVAISSLAGEEFKIVEVIGNMVVLTILCVIVFKLGLGMNISVIQGVWIVDPSAMTVSLRNVDVARFGPATVAISQGLDIGEVIVTAGVQALHPGQKVRLLGSGP